MRETCLRKFILILPLSFVVEVDSIRENIVDMASKMFGLEGEEKIVRQLFNNYYRKCENWPLILSKNVKIRN